MIESWSEEERAAAFAIFKKIARNNREWLAARRAEEIPTAYPMPHDVYEAHRLTMKSVSSEVGIFDEQGRIFLTRRPSKEEDPAEPYPNLWHIPGVRHIGNETENEALKRLTEDEIGIPIEMRLIGHKEYRTNGHASLSLLYIARIKAVAMRTDTKRQWFDPLSTSENIFSDHIAIIDYITAHAPHIH